jgi:hypothetical protein
MSDKEQQNTDESIEERVVQKLKKVITIKKELSDKQKAHIEKLAKSKAGKKYVQQVPVEDVELPTEVVPKKPRALRVKPIPEPTEEESSEPEVLIIKKKKKKQIIIEESESEDEPVKKPKKKPIVKAKPKTIVKRKPIQKKVEPDEPKEPMSYFRKRLF